MKILFCNYEYPPLGGGGGVINALLAQELARTHEVTVLTSQGLDLPRERIENGVRVIRVPVFFRQQQAVASLSSMLAFIPMAIKEGRKLVQTERFDVINTHFVLPTGPVGDVLARLGRIPNVLSLHGGDLYDPSKSLSPHRHPILRTWIKWLLKQADVVVGQSQNTLANMNHFYTKDVSGLRIPLGIPRPKLNNTSRARYGFAENEVLLVTVGRLVARKGLDQLIAMMATFKEQPIRLLVIGSGPQEERLKELAQQRQVADRVHFMGYVEEDEKFRLLQISDLYVSTSQHEGFGLVFLEAMACGLPVVCYNHGGQTDFLTDQETGYLIRLNDADQFGERCWSLISRPELRRRMGETNRQRVEDYFIDRCALRYERVFKEAIEVHALARRTWLPQTRASKAKDLTAL